MPRKKECGPFKDSGERRVGKATNNLLKKAPELKKEKLKNSRVQKRVPPRPQTISRYRTKTLKLWVMLEKKMCLN